MFDASTDPLGIGLQQRATQRRFQQAVDAVHSDGTAPTMLADPKWDSYFQAVDEAGGDKPVKYGYYDTAGEQDLSRDPQHAGEIFDAMPLPTLGNGPSSQLGTAVKLRRALSGLQGAQ
jgi:hypothetical protein